MQSPEPVRVTPDPDPEATRPRHPCEIQITAPPVDPLQPRPQGPRFVAASIKKGYWIGPVTAPRDVLAISALLGMSGLG